MADYLFAGRCVNRNTTSGPRPRPCQHPAVPGTGSYDITGGLNHVGMVVDALSTTETRVCAAGFTPHSHAGYAPGRRIYFGDPDGTEYEVVAYD